jgi:para-aminobenzoate synthetase component I
MRKWFEFKIIDIEGFTQGLLNWGNKFDDFILLNSNSSKIANHLYHEYDLIAACIPIHCLNFESNTGFENLRQFQKKYEDWIFGFFTYDVKNETEKLDSRNLDGLKFPELWFFIPKYVFLLKGKILQIGFQPEFSNPDEIFSIFNEIRNRFPTEIQIHRDATVVKQRFSKQEYLQTIEKIKKHIIKGDIYEINLCMEFFIENSNIEPVNLYNRLNSISPSPYSVFMKKQDKFLISSSPERFLAKRGNKIISQPIKGTIKRSINPVKDKLLIDYLLANNKERAENIMIVDLVRNDLSKTAKTGSVRVEELCKIYTYQQVHQMVSTITSEINNEKYDIVDVIKTSFPMGSMTGAPKIRAMELIEKYEKTKRGLYSGAVGYISPDKDFDFNVVIRSILYNSTEKYLSFTVGSAITHLSDAEMEYSECLLKAEGMSLALNCK